MATPRRHWFKVADSIAREPWSNDQVATFVRLLAFLNSRRARDELGPEEASRCVLRPGDLSEITGRYTLRSARYQLDLLGDVVSITVQHRGELTSIEWLKCAEFQGWASESREIPGRKMPSPTPTPTPFPTPKEEKRRSRRVHLNAVLPADPGAPEWAALVDDVGFIETLSARCPVQDMEATLRAVVVRQWLIETLPAIAPYAHSKRQVAAKRCVLTWLGNAEKELRAIGLQAHATMLAERSAKNQAYLDQYHLQLRARGLLDEEPGDGGFDIVDLGEPR